MILGQNRCGFFSPLVSIPSTALPETWLSFPSRIREVFMFGGLSGNLKQGEFGQGWALAGTGMCLRQGTSRTCFCRHFIATGLKQSCCSAFSIALKGDPSAGMGLWAGPSQGPSSCRRTLWQLLVLNLDSGIMGIMNKGFNFTLPCTPQHCAFPAPHILQLCRCSLMPPLVQQFCVCR